MSSTFACISEAFTSELHERLEDLFPGPLHEWESNFYCVYSIPLDRVPQTVVCIPQTMVLVSQTMVKFINPLMTFTRSILVIFPELINISKNEACL